MCEAVGLTYAWKGTGAELLATLPAIPVRLSDAHEAHYLQAAGISQRTAWEHEISILASAFRALPRATEWGLIMEYELPYEGGRRVDKVALAAENVLALEFKDGDRIRRSDLDQVRAYARDLSEYHSECRDRRVDPVLVLAGAHALRTEVDGTTIVGPTNLPLVMDELGGRGIALDVDKFLGGTYAPLPTLVEAARRVFKDEPLPAIRRAASAGVPGLIRWLHSLVAIAQEEAQRHLVLITGVPGSGKTLVGLQFVHEFGAPGEAPAVFLSGNGPLVELLQYVLNSKVFVKPMRNFILDYGVRKRALPPQHVLVFDEAQRAWDLEHVRAKHDVDRSEPDMLLEIAARLPGWSVLIGLVGEGQEIYIGEEGGLGQWANALKSTPASFNVHVPPHIAPLFSEFQPEVLSELNLTLSLRTHTAEHVQSWVSAFIQGDLESAAALAKRFRQEDYNLYVTGDLDRAKAYAISRYVDEPEKRYGLLASSKGLNLPSVGVDNSYYATKTIKVGPWYSAPRTDPASCCQLLRPVTEFQAQGLELDLPIVCWGDDLAWQKGWRATRRTKNAHDSQQLRLNSYRVLLTRGRDGTIVYVPPNLRDGQTTEVLQAFERAGAQVLEGP